jgi:hypothetical protein
MVYQRRVLKKRPASLTDEEWVSVWERGKLPLPERLVDPGYSYPSPDVGDLVLGKQISDLRWRLEQLCMALSKPSTQPSANGESSSIAQPGGLLSQLPELWDFLSRSEYGDGSKRSLGGMSLKLASGGLQVTLTDPTSASYCCLTGATLDDVFLALEIGLKESSLTWRSSSYAKSKK